MAEVETDIEGVETEVNSYRDDCKERNGRKGKCKGDLKQVLKRLEDNCEQVTIFIQTGDKCCKRTGCICDVDDCFVVLMDNEDPCDRTYILLDCICAVENCVEESCSQDDKCE